MVKDNGKRVRTYRNRPIKDMEKIDYIILLNDLAKGKKYKDLDEKRVTAVPGRSNRSPERYLS